MGGGIAYHRAAEPRHEAGVEAGSSGQYRQPLHRVAAAGVGTLHAGRLGYAPSSNAASAVSASSGENPHGPGLPG